MTSQTGQQVFTIHVLRYTSRSKVNQAMMYAQLLALEIFFFRIHAENKVGRLVPDFLLFVQKLYIRQEQPVTTWVVIYFGRPRFGYKIKTNFITSRTVNPELC